MRAGWGWMRRSVPDQDHRGIQRAVRGGDQLGVIGFGHATALALTPA
jgi:hypothetical protein